jgi:hypothetical protein
VVLATHKLKGKSGGTSPHLQGNIRSQKSGEKFAGAMTSIEITNWTGAWAIARL